MTTSVMTISVMNTLAMTISVTECCSGDSSDGREARATGKHTHQIMNEVSQFVLKSNGREARATGAK